MSQLIEEYLRAAGVRYFRGHHSDEYFFLAGPRRQRLHVHLDGEPSGDVTLTITPDRYYPARVRDALHAAVRDAATPELGVVSVQNSCDPALVGVVAQRRWLPSGSAALRADVDAAVAGAGALFDRIGQLAAVRVPGLLRDAG